MTLGSDYKIFVKTITVRLGDDRVINLCHILAERHDRLHVVPQPMTICRLLRRAWQGKTGRTRDWLPGTRMWTNMVSEVVLIVFCSERHKNLSSVSRFHLVTPTTSFLFHFAIVTFMRSFISSVRELSGVLQLAIVTEVMKPVAEGLKKEKPCSTFC